MTKGTFSSRCGLQREAGKPVSTSRQIQNTAAKAERQMTRVSAIAHRASSPERLYGPDIQDGLDNNYVGNFRSSRSYGSSQGHKRQHGRRRSRSYGNRITHCFGRERVCSYGTQRVYSYGGRKVRSYGQRRVFSYGERHGYSYGYGDRRLRLYGRERQHSVQHGHKDIGKKFKRLFTASYIGRLSSGAGALWVAGQFIGSFGRHLNFSSLPANLIRKYRWAGSERKNLSQAQAVWKSIPAQVRAGGPEALRNFHQGKSWSHIIAKSRGGPSTADNAIWWSHAKNHSLGSSSMSLADIADAKAFLRSDAIRAAVKQTASGMVKGAIVSVVVGGALACLECGLDYAEGKITKREMVHRVARAGVIDGGGAFFTTGIIVGISLLFPLLIPILSPVLFVLQGASFALMGARGVKLAKGWWAVLERQQFSVHSSFGAAVKAIPMRAKNLPAMANGKIIRTGSSIRGAVQKLSVGKTRKFSQDGQTEGKRRISMPVLLEQAKARTRIKEPPIRSETPENGAATNGKSNVELQKVRGRNDGA